MSEAQRTTLRSLEDKQKTLALALASVNDLDAIKEVVETIASIQKAINLMK